MQQNSSYFDHSLRPTALRTALAMSSVCGRASFSSGMAYGMGTSAPVIRSAGASRKSNASLSISRAAISEPTPLWGQPSSTVTTRWVFFTDSMIVLRSRGRSVLRLMTSTLMPSSSSVLATSSDTPTIREKVTMVTSLPSRSTLACPMGTTKSRSLAASLSGKAVPYNISFSSTTTRFSSRIAAFISPRASSLDQGATTFRPGTELYQAAKHCECWAATPEAAPLGPRNTMGTVMSPPVM
mmetsp:Transcript_4739/g.6508  ORF Transcript_4739/g.6508 Transcript_4739/m.6508 type:complete len:240 (-) Transcript_4739:445-1164(-)